MGKIINMEHKFNAEKPQDEAAVPPEGEEPLEVWECKCGCRLFYMTKEGHMCSECETIQVYG